MVSRPSFCTISIDTKFSKLPLSIITLHTLPLKVQLVWNTLFFIHSSLSPWADLLPPSNSSRLFFPYLTISFNNNMIQDNWEIDTRVSLCALISNYMHLAQVFQVEKDVKITWSPSHQVTCSPSKYKNPK